jgi:hypothetical protein
VASGLTASSVTLAALQATDLGKRHEVELGGFRTPDLLHAMHHRSIRHRPVPSGREPTTCQNSPRESGGVCGRLTTLAPQTGSPALVSRTAHLIPAQNVEIQPQQRRRRQMRARHMPNDHLITKHSTLSAGKTAGFQPFARNNCLTDRTETP